MPKGHDSLSIACGKVRITLDYSYHRWHEPEGSYLDWDIIGLYVNARPITEAEAKRIDPQCIDRFDNLIHEKH